MAARILIVEDEEPLTLLLRYNLEAEGFEVDSVARGDDAELHLRDHTPDLVLLDWMLPGLSGIELCRRLRSRRDTERIQALLRRAKPGHVAGLLSAGDLELDRTTRRVRRAGSELHLGPTEFRLLEFLMQAPGRVYSRAQLLDAVWGRDVYIDERTVDVHVGRLRKAITPANAKDPLRTVRGAGYAFDETFARS